MYDPYYGGGPPPMGPEPPWGPMAGPMGGPPGPFPPGPPPMVSMRSPMDYYAPDPYGRSGMPPPPGGPPPMLAMGPMGPPMGPMGPMGPSMGPPMGPPMGPQMGPPMGPPMGPMGPPMGPMIQMGPTMGPRPPAAASRGALIERQFAGIVGSSNGGAGGVSSRVGRVVHIDEDDVIADRIIIKPKKSKWRVVGTAKPMY